MIVYPHYVHHIVCIVVAKIFSKIIIIEFSNIFQDNNDKTAFYCELCEISFASSMQKNEHLNSQQHFTQSKLKEAMLKLPQQQQQQLHQQQQHQQNNAITRPNSALPSEVSSNVSQVGTNGDCCVFAHREYFNVDAYHSKILERSLQSSVELKFVRQKQSQLKADSRKLSAGIKTGKQELELKQQAFNELCKANNYFTEQLNLFKRFIQLCQQPQQQPQQPTTPVVQQQQQQQPTQVQPSNSINVIYINDQNQVQQQSQISNSQNNYINQCFFINQANNQNTAQIDSNVYHQPQQISQPNQQYYHQPQYVSYIAQQTSSQPQQQQQQQQTQYQQVQSNSIYINDQYSNYIIQNNNGAYITTGPSNKHASSGVRQQSSGQQQQSLFTYDDSGMIQTQQQQQYQQHQQYSNQQHQLINPNLISVPNSVQGQQTLSRSTTPSMNNSLTTSNSSLPIASS